MTNRLYYGDNPGILREHVADESVARVDLNRVGFQKAKRETKKTGQGKFDL